MKSECVTMTTSSDDVWLPAGWQPMSPFSRSRAGKDARKLEYLALCVRPWSRESGGAPMRNLMRPTSSPAASRMAFYTSKSSQCRTGTEEAG